MKIKIENHENNTTRVIDYPETVLFFVKVHYLSWGFYKVLKAGRDHFEIYDAFTGQHVDTVTKAKQGDITQ